MTVIWAAGMRANPVTTKIPGERDKFDRLLIDGCLRVPSVPGVFATGDAARAACDDCGNYALMSCQHATRMGAFAGNNAAAELLGVPPRQYHQKAYVTCLDLGDAGALFTRGWDREVEMVGEKRRRRSRRSTLSGSIRRSPSVPRRWLPPIRACDGPLIASRHELRSEQERSLQHSGLLMRHPVNSQISFCPGPLRAPLASRSVACTYDIADRPGLAKRPSRSYPLEPVKIGALESPTITRPLLQVAPMLTKQAIRSAFAATASEHRLPA